LQFSRNLCNCYHLKFVRWARVDNWFPLQITFTIFITISCSILLIHEQLPNLGKWSWIELKLNEKLEFIESDWNLYQLVCLSSVIFDKTVKTIKPTDIVYFAIYYQPKGNVHICWQKSWKNSKLAKWKLAVFWIYSITSVSKFCSIQLYCKVILWV